MTDQPLKATLHKPDTSREMTRWTIELNDFDIGYQPRSTVKAQVLIDFIVECIILEEDITMEKPKKQDDRLH